MADEDQPMLLGGVPDVRVAAQPYRVLARKYRPQSFGELIGQDAMVQTLANAIRRERIPHAMLLTGVRGVGKTSTARLVAKALNCIGPDGEGGPTIDPCGRCEPCRAIAEGRHIDVVEMDAASHTGVDDVREIIEAVRYASVSARYKIYVVDEVHMLSKNAFNALLKTLEEPPAHVKFLFATTEIQKVPVTVLSRCMRFDLKRIPADKLAAHFGAVAEAEGIEAEPAALAIIARAAEGSARDGLSMLDQAIAHGEGAVREAQVRDMLGLGDRGAVRDLLGQLLAGDGKAVLATVKDQYDLGVEPHALLRGLLEAVHGITRARTGAPPDPAQSAEEREAYLHWATMLPEAAAHRIWQLLLKGLAEVAAAPLPLEAAEMALLRIVYAAGLPDPGEMVRRLETGEAAAAAPVPASASASSPPSDFRAMIDVVRASSPHLAFQLEESVGLVRYAPPELVIRPRKPIDLRELASALQVATGSRWQVSTAEEQAEPSLFEQEQAVRAAERAAILETPIIQAALEAFPEAELLRYTLPERGAA